MRSITRGVTSFFQLVLVLNLSQFGYNGKDLTNVNKNDSVNHLAIFQQTSNAEHLCALFEVLQYKRVKR